MNYYRRYMGDYNSKTAALSLAEHGAYTVLLDTCYSTERPLPASIDALCRICRAMSKTEQEAVKSVADSFFPIGADGLRHNPRADQEIVKAQATIAKQRESGVESAAKRWSTDQSTDGLTHNSTDGSAIQPSTTNHQPLAVNLQTPPARKKRELAPLPENWTPKPETVARLAEQFKFTNGDGERYAAAFRDACAAKGYRYADFDAAFSNCVRKDWPGFRNGAATMPKHTGEREPNWS